MNGFILTSNRDEAISRETLPPQQETYNGAKLYFPKDKEAGGTWLGITDLKRCICLMNGAEKPHERKAEYRKSRGVVVKDFLSAKKLNRSFEDYNLNDIEAFTMIIVDWHNGLVFYELIWDGENRKISKLPLKEHIWSSSPLYTEEMKGFRKIWFQELKLTTGLGAKSLWNFHHNAGEGNKDFDLVIDRGFLKTQSISQVVNSSEALKFTYENLKNKEIETERFSI